DVLARDLEELVTGLDPSARRGARLDHLRDRRAAAVHFVLHADAPDRLRGPELELELETAVELHVLDVLDEHLGADDDRLHADRVIDERVRVPDLELDRVADLELEIALRRALPGR